MDLARDLPLIILFFVLFGLAQVIAAAETAILRVPIVRIQVEAETDRRAQRLLAIAEDLPRVLNTVLLVALLTQIGAATVTGVLAERWFGGIGVTLASVVLSFVLFVYSEAIPKTLAVRHPYPVARALTRLIVAVTVIMRPLVGILVWFADLQAPGKGVQTSSGVTEEELRRLAADAASEGRIDLSDMELLERSFEFGDATVEDILVPRNRVVAVDTETTARDALDLAIRTDHRRLPVYASTIDDVIGMVRLRDLAKAIADGDDVTAGDLARPVLVVPESMRLVDLLRAMKSTRRRLAVAVEEHGGTAGIVTLDDVVDELVGDDEDFEMYGSAIRQTGPDRWSIEADLDVDDVERALGIELPEGDWRTIGGLVIATAGTLPEVGETVEVDGTGFRIVARSRQRLHRFEVSPTATDAEGS
jgi:CBS domain containing-hemolysin-like protein